jgi:glutamate-1-semialdehyde 2,1-aminomutase
MTIRERYLTRTPRSARAFDASGRYLPGGVTRQAGQWDPYPVTLERGEGTRVWDVDGNCYFDLINNYASLVHGHGNPEIMAAVSSALTRGVAWVGNSASQAELAKLITDRVASVERVRFTNSGAEAANLALVIARAVTGRPGFLMARYGYHGSVAETRVGSFDAASPPNYVARYNDLADFERILAEHGDEIAAVFLEPVMGFGGIVEGSREFLTGVIAAARQAGALMVLDEVVTFRLGTGGAQGNLGLTPDLTMFGKIIGGGFPIGAVGGREAVMAAVDGRNVRSSHSGTFNGNPISTTAGVASVNALTAERIERIGELAARLRDGLVAAAGREGIPLRVNRAGSILGLVFQTADSANPLARDDRDLMGRFHLAALNHGLLMAPRGMIAMSTAMTAADVDEMVDRAAAAIGDLANEG